jgi:hypothetical protein
VQVQTQGSRKKRDADGTDQGAGGGEDRDKDSGDAQANVTAQQVVAWAARFSQAAAELAHMGVVRPSKRKKEQAVQLMFHPTRL